MIAVVSGTNRPGSATRRIAGQLERVLVEAGREVRLLDLVELPAALFAPESYGSKPEAFADYQEAVLAAAGMITVVPEYNGSFPGALKYFVDMLRFPESLLELPAAFVGVASGRWGGVRAVEQLEMVFQYRKAHLYGRRVFLPGIRQAFDEHGRLADPAVLDRLAGFALGFAGFCDRLRGGSEPSGI